MRIIGGNLKGRRYYPPSKNWPTRPTTDVSKEALFNILENQLDFDKIKALDLFGGTGAHTYELVSRGCRAVTYVDKFGGCISYVKKMVAEFQIKDKVEILKQDVKKYIQQSEESFDYIFAGPPYPLAWIDEIPDLLLERNLLNDGGLLILETDPNHEFKEHKYFREVRNYGQTHFWFFTKS